MEITFGWDPTFGWNQAKNAAQARQLLSYIQDLGATSIETYIHWKVIEPEPGHFVWDEYDRELELIRECGMRWVPFIILGPHYVTPAWFQNSNESLYARCLEHDHCAGVPQHMRREPFVQQ